MGCNLFGAIGRLVDNRYAGGARRIEVDGVQADPGAPNHPNARRQGFNVGCTQRLERYNDARRPRGGSRQSGGVGKVAKVEHRTVKLVH